MTSETELNVRGRSNEAKQGSVRVTENESDREKEKEERELYSREYKERILVSHLPKTSAYVFI